MSHAYNQNSMKTLAKKISSQNDAKKMSSMGRFNKCLSVVEKSSKQQLIPLLLPYRKRQRQQNCPVCYQARNNHFMPLTRTSFFVCELCNFFFPDLSGSSFGVPDSPSRKGGRPIRHSDRDLRRVTRLWCESGHFCATQLAAGWHIFAIPPRTLPSFNKQILKALK